MARGYDETAAIQVDRHRLKNRGGHAKKYNVPPDRRRNPLIGEGFTPSHPSV
jgi:hypothetical protein